jgi:hypothetical protein
LSWLVLKAPFPIQSTGEIECISSLIHAQAWGLDLQYLNGMHSRSENHCGAFYTSLFVLSQKKDCKLREARCLEGKGEDCELRKD